MAAPKCRLEMWNPVIAGTATNKWIKAQNPENRNAVITLVIKESLGNPKRCQAVMSNRARNFASESGTFVYTYYDSWDNAAGNATIAERRGVLTDLFTDFMPIRLINEATNQIYFAGRIRDVKTGHQQDKGETIKIEASDALDELIQIDGKGIGLRELQFYKGGTVMEDDDGYPHTFPGHTQSDMVKALISLAYKKDMLQINQPRVTGYSEVKMHHLVQNTIYYPLSTSSGIYSANIVTDDDGTNLYNRFENETQIMSADRTLDISKMDKGVLGEILKITTATPQTSQGTNDNYGWDYFTDPNISYGSHADFRGKNFDPTVAAPPAMFNVFERGTRIYNIEPATYGLAVKFPSSSTVPSQGHRTTYTGGSPTAQYASKPMSTEFDFTHPKEGLFTSVLLTYDDAEEKHDTDANQKKGGKGKEKQILFEIMYVRNILGKFNYETTTGSGANMTIDPFDFADDGYLIEQDNSGNQTETRPGLHSAEYLDLYSEDGTTKLVDKVARIQYQSKSSSNSTTYGYILITEASSAFRTRPAGTYRLVGAGDSEGNQASNMYCYIDLQATIPQEGYPRRVWNLEKQKKLKKGVVKELTALRHEIASILSRSSLDIVDGQYQISGPPVYFIDLDVKSVTSVTGGQRVEFQHLGQTNGAGTAVDVSRYGFRQGMQIAKMNASNRAENYTASFTITNSAGGTESVMQDVYGYCFDIPTATQYSVNTHTTSNLAVGDPVRLYIPIRTGDCIRVENVMSNVAGNHLVTDVEFTEEPVQMTKIKSTGVNEGFGLEGTIYQAILAGSRDESDLLRMLPKGHQAAIWTGLFSAVDFNTVQWQPVDTKAEVILMDGTIYNVDTSTTDNSRNTDSSGTDQNGTRFGLATPPAAGDDILYYIYLDPDDENIAAGEKYHFYTRPAKTPATGSDPVYEQDGDNIIVAWMKAASTETGLAEFGVYRDGKPDNSGRNLDSFIHRGSATSALLKKGAQTFTTDLALYATTYDHDDAHKKLKWHGGEEGATTTNATIKLADGDTRTITRGGDLSNDGGGQYRVTTSGNLTGTMVNSFDVSSTYYAYIDFAQETSGDMNLRFTKDYSVPYGDDRVLLAMIVVAANASKGRSPMILPLTTKSLSINAVAIAANSITADHITSASIDVDHLQLTGTGAIGGIASNGALNFSFGTNTGSLDNIADGSTKKSVTQAEKDGIADGIDAKEQTDKGFDADGNIKRNVVAKGAADSPTAYFWENAAGAPSNLVIINDHGLAGYSGVTGTYSEGSNASDGLTLPSTPQFEIRSANGKAFFGGGTCILDSTGITIEDGKFNLKTASSGSRVEMIASGIYTYSGSTEQVKINQDGIVLTTTGSSLSGTNLYFKTGSATVGYATASSSTFTVGTGNALTLQLGSAPGGGGGDSNQPNTETIAFFCEKLNFHHGGSGANFDKWVVWPVNTPEEDEVLTVQTITGSGNSAVAHLAWTAGGGVSTTANYAWTGEHRFDRDGSGGNAATPGLMLKSRGTPSAPPSGYGGLFVDQTNNLYNLYFRTPDGTVPIVQGNSVGGSAGEANEFSFKYIAVSGESTIQADTDTDTLTIAAGANITLTTNASTDTLTIAAAGGGGGSYTHPDPARFNDGSESNPTYSFTNASGHGMYRASSNLKFALSGDETFDINSATISCLTANFFVKDGGNGLPVRDGTDGEVDVQYGSSGFFYKVSSSAKTKMNIRDLEIDSSAVYSLVPKSYEGKKKVYDENEASGWRETGEAGGTMFGLIAEDVDKILPALVTYDENEEPSNVDYKMISVLLVEEMKKLKDRIEVLENA